jgi:predicted secreted Zn-dependent protease
MCSGMLRRAGWRLAVVVMLALTTSAYAGPVQENRKDSTYTVTGRDGHEILASMAAWSKRAKAQLGKEDGPAEETLAGLTRAKMRLDYVLRQSSEGCRIMQARVGIGISVALPVWTPDPRASVATREFWRDFQHRVQVHEEHHVAIARRYARQLADSVERIQASSCSTAERMAKRQGEAIVAQLRKAQADFDKVDGHLKLSWARPDSAVERGLSNPRAGKSLAWAAFFVAYAIGACYLWALMARRQAGAERAPKGPGLQDDIVAGACIFATALLPPLAMLVMERGSVGGPAVLVFLLAWVCALAPAAVVAGRITAGSRRR